MLTTVDEGVYLIKSDVLIYEYHLRTLALYSFDYSTIIIAPRVQQYYINSINSNITSTALASDTVVVRTCWWQF